MKNAIAVYLNYIQKRLTEYGVFLIQEDTPFIRDVFSYYFETYLDNYYYHIFHTVDTDYYNDDILKIELDGIMKEILDDYKEYELEVSNEEYATNQKLVIRLKDFVYEIIKIEKIKFASKEEIPSKIQEFVNNNEIIKRFLEDRMPKFIKMVTETYQKRNKLLNFQTQFFQINDRKFTNHPEVTQLELVPTIKALDIYNKNLVKKTLDDKKLDQKKLITLIQKISLEVLKEYEEGKESKERIVELPNTIITRGKIVSSIKELLDNSLLCRYITLGISYEVYRQYANLFDSDYNFACIYKYNKDYSEAIKTMNDVARELFFEYYIIRDCDYEKRNNFLEYRNENLEVLLYEEE